MSQGKFSPHLHVLETVSVGVWGLDGKLKKRAQKKIYVGGWLQRYPVSFVPALPHAIGGGVILGNSPRPVLQFWGSSIWRYLCGISTLYWLYSSFQVNLQMWNKVVSSCFGLLQVEFWIRKRKLNAWEFSQNVLLLQPVKCIIKFFSNANLPYVVLHILLMKHSKVL